MKGSRRRAARSLAYSSSTVKRRRDRAAAKNHLAARTPVVTATLASPSPAAQPGVTLPLPAVRPSVSASVRRSHEPRWEDERGVLVAGTGSQWSEEKD